MQEKLENIFLASLPSEFNLTGYLSQDGLQCEQCYLKQTLALKKSTILMLPVLC